MRELTGDIWKVVKEFGDVDAVAVTTNLCTRKDGTAIMGAGIALEASKRYREAPRLLGDRIKYWERTQYVFEISDPRKTPVLLSFPTKGDWRKPSVPSMIEKSARELVHLTDMRGWKTVLLPRPGCGLGGLKWENVKPLLSSLDDRFVVVDRG